MASLKSKQIKKKKTKPCKSTLEHPLFNFCSEDGLADLCSWLADDDGDQMFFCHSYRIDMITSAVDCALTNGSIACRRKKLKNFLQHDKFLSGKEVQWQVAQFAVLAEIAEFLRKKDIQRFNFSSKEVLKELLVSSGLIPALKKLMALSVSTRDYDFESWPCISYQCLSILGNLTCPEDLTALILPTHKERKPLEKIAQNIVDAGGIVEMVVDMLRGAAGPCEIIRAAWSLRNILSLSPKAVNVVVEQDGIPVLVELFRPGQFQKKAACHRDEGFAVHEKTTLSEGFDTLFNCCDPQLITDDECYRRLMMRVSGLQENTGAMLTVIAYHSAAYCHQVFETRWCVNAALKWLRHPFFLGDHDQSVATSAAQLLLAFLQNKAMAVYLVEECDLITVLERCLYMPENWPLDDVIQCSLMLLSHGSLFVDMLALREKVVVALGIYCHSKYKIIQDVSLAFTLKLCKAKLSVVSLLHNRGIITAVTMARYELPLWEAPVPQLTRHLVSLFKKTVTSNWHKNKPETILPPNVCDMEKGFLKEKGNTLFKYGKYEEAIKTYSGGIFVSNNEDEAILLSNRAECYLRLERYDDVVRDCTHSLCIGFHDSPVYAKTLFRRAKAFHKLNRPFEAIGDLAACVRENPGVKQVSDLYNEVLVNYRQLQGAVYRVHTCGGCGMENEGMKKCSRCNQAYFCSRTCLKQAWPNHKKVCQQAVSLPLD